MPTHDIYCNACDRGQRRCHCLADAMQFLGNDWDEFVYLSYRGQLRTLLAEQRHLRAQQARIADTIPTKYVDPETVSNVIDLVIALNRNTLRELAKH